MSSRIQNERPWVEMTRSSSLTTRSVTGPTGSFCGAFVGPAGFLGCASFDPSGAPGLGVGSGEGDGEGAGDGPAAHALPGFAVSGRVPGASMFRGCQRPPSSQETNAPISVPAYKRPLR